MPIDRPGIYDAPGPPDRPEEIERQLADNAAYDPNAFDAGPKHEAIDLGPDEEPSLEIDGYGVPAADFGYEDAPSSETVEDDPDELAGSLTVVMPLGEPVPGVRRVDLPAPADTAVPQEGSEPGDDIFAVSDSPPASDAQLRAIYDRLASAGDSVDDVIGAVDAAGVELITLRAAGLIEISDDELRRINDLRPSLVEVQIQVRRMGKAAALGSAPSPAETAQIGARLTEAGETARFAQEKAPGSRLWGRITVGLRTAVRAFSSVFLMVVHSEVKGISVTFNAGVAQITFNLNPPAPDPAAPAGGAAPGR